VRQATSCGSHSRPVRPGVVSSVRAQPRLPIPPTAYFGHASALGASPVCATGGGWSSQLGPACAFKQEITVFNNSLLNSSLYEGKGEHQNDRMALIHGSVEVPECLGVEENL
jgi:hypothetical protein